MPAAHTDPIVSAFIASQPEIVRWLLSCEALHLAGEGCTPGEIVSSLSENIAGFEG